MYEIVAEIPAGKVATYGHIALMLGNPKRARMVGQAMFNAPEDKNLQCHRVVNCKGEMAADHVFGGQEKQREMLMEEGVKFKPNGCVDLKVCMIE